MSKQKTNKGKMNTYRKVLVDAVKNANKSPMDYLKRVKREQEKEGYTRQDHERVNE